MFSNNLFVDWVEEEPPFQPHSETSKDAADSIRPSTASLREKVYALIASSSGMTDEEIQVALDMNPSTERPRRIELVNAGRVRDSGRTKATRSGRQAVVWVATNP